MSTELIEKGTTETAGKAVREQFVQPRFSTIPGEEAYELQVLMPGVSKNGLDISLVDDQLTIVGRREHRVPESWRPLFCELGDFDYRLRVRLNIRVDQDEIHAKVEDGVLHLTLPIHGEAKPRRIEVR